MSVLQEDQAGKGNIVIHGERRYKCKECGKTFIDTKGTMFYRLRYSDEFVTQMVTLIAYGCPIAAIVAAFGIDERTIADWLRRAGEHCQKVHEHLIEQPHGLVRAI
jgi:transposase-like protein